MSRSRSVMLAELKRDAATLGSWLVVCGVAALVIGAFLIWNNDRVMEKARIGATKADINTLLSALELYRINTGHYPSAEEGLQALVDKKLIRKLEEDPWGRPYRYVVGPSVPDGVGIYSLGPDGVSATQGNDPNDVNSWSHKNDSSDKPVVAEEPSVPIMVWLPWALAGVGLSTLIVIVGRALGRRSREKKECAENAGGD